MNSSKMSLKEGFDFLFEEAAEDESTTTDGQKLVIKGLTVENMSELMNPGGTADAVTNILAFDGIIRKGSGRKSTMALRGETFTKVFTSLNKSKSKHIKLIQNFVPNRGQAESLLEIYASSLQYLEDKGFNRFKALDEAKQITTTTKGADVLDTIMDKFSNQINFFNLKDRIFKKLTQIVPNLKDDISGKSAGAENLSDDDTEFMSGVRSELNRLVNSDPETKEDLKDTLAQFGELSVKLAAIRVQYRNNETVQDEVKGLSDVLSNFRSQIQDSAKNLKDSIEGDEPLLNTDDLRDVLSSDFKDSFNGIEVDDSDRQDLKDLKDELDRFMSSVSQEELPEDDSEDESGEDKVALIIKAAQDLFESVEREESKIEGELSKIGAQDLTVALFNKILKQLTDYANSISIDNARLMFTFKHNKNFNENATRDQKSEVQDIIDQLNDKQQEAADLINDLMNNSKESGSINDSEIESALTTVAFDPNTASRIDLEEFLPDADKDEVIAKAKSEFEDIKTQISGPTPQTDASSGDDEVKTTDDDQYEVTTTLGQPADGDYNDFLRKYLAIASFLALTTDASNEILSDSARRLKSGELVNMLEKWSTKAKVDNGVLSNSISNLAKFTNTNVEGIIFERADANKYFVKMNAKSFSGSSFVLQDYMKYNKSDCFANINIFTPPVFELTDSKGETFYPDINAALTHFMSTDSQKRSVKREGDIVKFYLEEKPYFLLSEAGGGDFEFRLTALTKDTNKSTALLSDELKKSVSDLGGFENVFGKYLKLGPEDIEIVRGFMDEYAKTRVEDFKSGLGELDIDLNEDDTKTLVDAITTDSDDANDQQKTQTLVSKGKDKPAIKNNISSVEELSNDKVIRKMMSAIYRDGSLNNFLAAMTPVEFAAVKAGKDKTLIDNFKARAILAINPELGAIKLNVKDIYNGEMKEVFDTLFSKNYKFDESAMRAAYTKTIVSAFDKLIGKEHSRITEGLFSGIKRMAAAGAANLLKMAPVLALVKAITFIPFVGAAIPFIMAGFVSWITFSSWKDIAKWEKAKRDYQDDPYSYIEKTLFEDKSSKKVIKNIVNAAAADVIVARLNPVFVKQSQKTVTAGISGGASEFQKNFDEQMSEFNSLSDEDRRAAKSLNDRVIGQLAKTKYYNSVITEAMVNMIFNEVMFGKDRVSDATRKMLLGGNFDMRSDARKDLQDTLVSIIEKSAIKNNLVDFVHKEVKKLKNKRFTKADDAELKRRQRVGSEKDVEGLKNKLGAAMSDNVVFDMHAQYLISPEQIHEEAIDELVQKVVGLSKEEYQKRFEYNKNEGLFSENIISGSLAKLLFEADQDVDAGFEGASEEPSAKQKELQDEREEANKQKDNTTAVLAGLGAGSYVHSLWLSMFMRKYADKQIVKFIMQTIPGKAATAAKYVSKFSPDPASAANDNLLGQDMGHGLFEFTDKGVKKQLYAYFYSEAKYAGQPEALSGQMIDPTTGKATMIQHDLYSYYNDPTNNYYNKMWFNSHGMEVDPTGVVKVIDPALCKALSANSPEMAKATNIIMTNLEGKYPVETSAVEAKLKTFSIWSDFDENLLNFSGKDKVEVVKAFAKKVMAQKLGGPDMAPHPVHFGDSDPEIKSFINVLERQLKVAAGDSPEAQKSVADAMGEFYKTCKTAVKGGEAFMQTLVKKGQSADVIFSSENADALKSITDKEAKVMVQGFEKSIETIKALVPEERIDVAFKKAVGMVAQQGHNPMLDFDVIPGQAGTASQEQEINARHTIPGDKSWFNSLSKGVADYNSVVGPLALASKVLSKFYTRGIKSGELARQLTKMLNFKNIVYTDILNVMTGNNIVSVPQGLTKNGHAENQSLSPDELLQSEAHSNSSGSAKITELDPGMFEGEKAPSVPRADEGFVHTTKLSSYLFENRLVTKRKKTSKIKSGSLSLNEEIETHNNLKDLFKKLV
ncbi:MAG: hypothetical protein HOK65_11385 [Crocinitomicaceae bacterium]|nr:hypothetical protein [Crocinitomicaceae bacterium]